MQLAKNDKIWLMLAVLISVISYYPVFFNDFTNWDDNFYVTDNDLIKSFSLHNIYTWFTKSHTGLYHPLVLFSFALDYSVNGLNPLMFHITNMLLHVLNTLLVFRLVYVLFNNRFIAIITMLLFGVHTLHVESVAWITERKDVLYSFFFLTSLNLYVLYNQKKKPGYLLMTFLFFIMSLLSKASAVTLPVNLLIIDYLYGRRLISKRVINEKIPFFIMSAIFGMLTIYAHHHHGSLTNSTGLTFFTRVLISGKALMFYFIKTLLPIKLSAYYPMPQIPNKSILFGIAMNLISYLILLIGMVLTFKRSKIIFTGIVFFIINIALFLVPVGVPIIQADRFIYIPSIGLFVIISYGLYYLFKKYPKIKTAGLIFISLYILFLSVLTFQQTKAWSNSLILWNNVINTTGKTYFPLLKRGIAYREEQNYKAALSDLNESIRLNHNNYYAYENRGFIYLVQKKYNKAIDDFRSSLEFNPESSYAYCSLGFAFLHLDNYKEAMENLNKAIEIYPGYADAYKNRGEVYICMENYEEACNDLKQALSLGLTKSDEEDVKTLVKEYCGEE